MSDGGSSGEWIRGRTFCSLDLCNWSWCGQRRTDENRKLRDWSGRREGSGSTERGEVIGPRYLILSRSGQRTRPSVIRHLAGKGRLIKVDIFGDEDFSCGTIVVPIPARIRVVAEKHTFLSSEGTTFCALGLCPAQTSGTQIL